MSYVDQALAHAARGETRRTQGIGDLYVCTNPAWPGYSKIGRSVDVARRLYSYQTASPYRDYEITYTRTFADIQKAERALKALIPGLRAKGEWVHIHHDDAATLIDSLPAS